MRRIAIALAAAMCATAAVATSVSASGHPIETTVPAPMTSKSEGVIKNSAGEVIGGWKELSTDTQRTIGSAAESGGRSFTPMAKEYPGGGTWDYGTYIDSAGYKHCWSFYHHPTVRHSATADMTLYDPRDGSVYSRHYEKAWADPNQWAFGEPPPAKSYDTGTCKVYWSKL